jgi:hypothetical protein
VLTSYFVSIFVGDMLLFLSGVGSDARLCPRSAPLVDSSRSARRCFDVVESTKRQPFCLALSPAPGTYLCGGRSAAYFRKFVAYFLLAAAVWTPLIVGISTGLGRHSYTAVFTQ